MSINLGTVLGALPNLVPLFGQAVAVKDLVTEIIHGFHGSPTDQKTIRAAIEDLQADNDEGHARYQAKLAAAEKR